VKFLVDAQLPRSLTALLLSAGHDAVHTLDLPAANRTSDEVLCRLAAEEQRVLVTKDGDFVVSFLLRRMPPKLLFVTTGNISNKELLALFRGNLQTTVGFLTALSCFVEIDRSGLSIRD
jgi:predicted nuclease of predicted toxin-antitoxin system